jgi:hypothetical protein
LAGGVLLKNELLVSTVVRRRWKRDKSDGTDRGWNSFRFQRFKCGDIERGVDSPVVSMVR